jgi:DDE family transposase
VEAEAPLPALTAAFERYQRTVSQERVAELLQGYSVFTEECRLTAWIVIWLILFQRLHPKGTQAVAVRELLTGPVRAFVREPNGVPAEDLSANTSAYCQARSKLPLEVAWTVSQDMFQFYYEQYAPRLRGVNCSLFVLDGSTFLLENTPELVKAYPPARNQHGAGHWPTMRVLVAHDLVSGLAMPPCWGPLDGPHAVSEQGLAKQMIPLLPKGSAALGDRNDGVFSMAYYCKQHQHPCLFRLTEARARKLHGGGVAPASNTDQTIRWTPSREDLRNNPEIPADAYVDGRLLGFKVRDAQGKFQKLYFFTSFTIVDVPAEEIPTVYGYRWRIETDLRSLKREVRLHMINAKSEAMVGKELLLGVAAYNLIRVAMNQAATALNLDPRQLSFSLAQDTLNAFLPAFANASSDAERQRIADQMLRVFRQSTLPHRRKRRSSPRMIWPRPCPYPKRKVAAKRKAAKTKKGRA